MTARPTRATIGGTVYLDLRKTARATARPTDELLQIYALEAFLDRLGRSPHADRFVLKGGVLLAAFDARRPTRDVDLAGVAVADDLVEIHGVINDVVRVVIDDGLELDPATTTVESIREGDAYGGARVHIHGMLSTAQVHFHVDVNIGDPLWPLPERIELPRILGGSTLAVLGYRIELVIAEKVVTALQRGTANTRWRDFVDLAALSRLQPDHGAVVEAIRRVAAHRGAAIQPLSEVLVGFAPLAQRRWTAWRRKQRLTDTTPPSFADLLDDVVRFADPFLLPHGP